MLEMLYQVTQQHNFLPEVGVYFHEYACCLLPFKSFDIINLFLIVNISFSDFE